MGGGVNSIPHTISYRDMTITVIVKGRKPLCWHCQQLGHFSRSCPQKPTKITTLPTTTTTIMTIVAAAATTKTIPSTNESPKPETGDHPDKEEEGWAQVTREGKKKKTPLKKINNNNSTKRKPNDKFNNNFHYCYNKTIIIVSKKEK